jgi:hypothetical protein
VSNEGHPDEKSLPVVLIAAVTSSGVGGLLALLVTFVGGNLWST